MAEPELFAKGINGQLALYSNKLCILRKGFTSVMSQGLKGEKSILLSSISSIQLKKAGLLTNGYIQFSFMGGQEAKGGIFQGAADENTILFRKKQQAAFEEIKNQIENRTASEAPSGKTSDADELTKFAALRDKGILTEEEFQQKKKLVLGL